MPDKNLAQRFLVKPHTKVRLRDWDTAWAGTKLLQNLKGDELKQEARETIHRNLERLSDAQELLWASDRHSLLVVLQGMDASGKDGLVKHVMSGLNPQGCQVTSFKQPSEEELEHDFLWRYAKALPPRGRIGIFNRSHYEDVLVVRVHPEWLDKQNCRPSAVILYGIIDTRTSISSKGISPATARSFLSFFCTSRRRNRNGGFSTAWRTQRSTGSFPRPI